MQFQKHRMHCAAAMLCAVLLSAGLTGCYKGDGTEVRVRKAAKVEDNPYADQIDAAFTDVSVDPNAKTEYPFLLDAAALTEPKQDILLVMIYDCAENPHSHTQAVTYYDKNGCAYRYRHPIEADGDWYPVLRENYDAGATVVNIMSDEERQTLWYLSNHIADYQAMQTVTKDTGKDIYGVTKLYLIDEHAEAVEIGCYDDVSSCRDSSEIAAFLDWYRYFYHGDFRFAG